MSSPDIAEPIYEIVSSSFSAIPPPVPIMVRNNSLQSEAETPPLLSPSSSVEGMPTNSSGTLRQIYPSTNLNTRSMSSSSITFAPLPVLEPRKRASSAQLGVAARSQMLRNRRAMMMGQAIDEGDTPDYYCERKKTIWDEPQFHDPGLAEDAVEDAFLALGRMVKGAGKSLWRKVSLGQKSRRIEDAAGGKEETPLVPKVVLFQGEESSQSPKPSSPESTSPPPLPEKEQVGALPSFTIVDEPDEFPPSPKQLSSESDETDPRESLESPHDEQQGTPILAFHAPTLVTTSDEAEDVPGTTAPAPDTVAGPVEAETTHHDIQGVDTPSLSETPECSTLTEGSAMQ